MFNSLTPRAHQTLVLARKEADRFNHDYVGTEHLLLGLIKLDQGTGVIILKKMGLDLDVVRAEVEKQMGNKLGVRMYSNMPYTPRVMNVISLAELEAKKLNHAYVGTEHLLLGLLQVGEGIAVRVLKNLEVDVARVRREVLRWLDPNFVSLDDDSQTFVDFHGMSVDKGTFAHFVPEQFGSTFSFESSVKA